MKDFEYFAKSRQMVFSVIPAQAGMTTFAKPAA